MKKATFAGGCFWCTEALFQKLKGVFEVVSGYAGGSSQKPTYENIHDGIGDHAEAIQVEYDPKEISYEDLLYVFLRTHDPTSPDHQGYDVGPEYRSMILFANGNQEKLAKMAIQDAQKDYKKPIVTEVKKLTEFFPAEGHHQDFYKKFPNKGYCRLVIDPKIKKLEKDFKKYLKPR